MSKRVWKLQDFVAHSGRAHCARLGEKSGQVLATGGDDKKVNIWKVGKPHAMMSLTGHSSAVECLVFDKQEEVLVVGCAGGSMQVWNLEYRKMAGSLAGHRTACEAVEFHPYGEFFASGSADTNLKIWDLRRKSCIQTYRGHTSSITSIRFSPHGRWVATGGQDNQVKLWDLTAGKIMRDLDLHKGPITSIAFHPKEYLLATGSADRTTKLWSLETFQAVGSTDVVSSPIQAVKFYVEEQAVLSASHDALRVYPTDNLATPIDTIEVDWRGLQDLRLCCPEEKLIAISAEGSQLGIWVADLQRREPYQAAVGGVGVGACGGRAYNAPTPGRGGGARTPVVPAAAPPPRGGGADGRGGEAATASGDAEDWDAGPSTLATAAGANAANVAAAGGKPLGGRPRSSDETRQLQQQTLLPAYGGGVNDGEGRTSASSRSPPPGQSCHGPPPARSVGGQSPKALGAKAGGHLVGPPPVGSPSPHGSPAVGSSAGGRAGRVVDDGGGGGGVAFGDFLVDRGGGASSPLAGRGLPAGGQVGQEDRGSLSAPVQPPHRPPQQQQPQRPGPVTPEQISQLSAQHPPMRTVLQRRLEQVRRLKDLWSRGNFASLPGLLNMPQDHAVFCDLVRAVMANKMGATLNLDACLVLLPIVREMLASKYDDFAQASAQFAEVLLLHFGDLVAETRRSCANLPERQLDLAREERLRKCDACYDHFRDIYRYLAELRQAGGGGGGDVRILALRKSLHAFLQRC